MDKWSGSKTPIRSHCTCMRFKLQSVSIFSLFYLLALKLSIFIKLSQYKEDFGREREDRIRAAEARIKIEEQFKAYKEAHAVPSKQHNTKVRHVDFWRSCVYALREIR